MRLIDADANIETMKKCAANPESEQALLCYRFAQRILEEAPTVELASPWRKVEEPPEMKETKELPGFFMSGLCALFDRYSKVFDLGYATRSNYMGGGIKWHSVYATRPTHWMPIEFPIGFQKKEDA